MKSLRIVIVFAVVATVFATPLPQQNVDETPSTNDASPSRDDKELALTDKLNDRCSRREPSACLMLKIVNYANRLVKKADFSLTDSLRLSRLSDDKNEEPVELETTSSSSSSSSRGIDSDEEAVGRLVAGKMYRFVASRALRWNVVDGAELVLEPTPQPDGQIGLDLTLREQLSEKETGRGKMKHMGPLMAAGAMKMGMIGLFAFKALALLVGKALLLSKLAFILAAIVGLRKLFGQQKHVTYEVVSHPHQSHHAEHGHGGGGGGADSYSSGWGRSIDVAPTSTTQASDPHVLAYRAHAR